jgi:hypothetical protein
MWPNSKGRICKIHTIETGLRSVTILLEAHVLHIFKEAVIISTQATSNTKTIKK